MELINANQDAYIDFNIPWTLNLDYKIDYRRVISSNLDTMYLTQSVGVRGDFSVTKNWKVYGIIDSCITGTKGNQEYFIYGVKK